MCERKRERERAREEREVMSYYPTFYFIRITLNGIILVYEIFSFCRATHDLFVLLLHAVPVQCKKKEEMLSSQRPVTQ